MTPSVREVIDPIVAEFKASGKYGELLGSLISLGSLLGKVSFSLLTKDQ